MTELDTTTDFFEEPSDTGSPGLGRARLTRPPFVPTWVYKAAAVVVALIAIVVLGVLFAGSVSRATVPKVVGLTVDAAQTTVAEAHLELVTGERRFSAIPEGTIIEQSPEPGQVLRRGETVRVVVSAGTEEFAMPDITGSLLAAARKVLEGKGLEVRIETEPSQLPSDTVLATNPSPGVMVRTGSIVRVTVAAPGGGGGSALQPLNMQGISVTIDPAVTPNGQTDISLEVARRLRSLIEASGGTVLTTRSMTDTGTAASAQIRVRRAREGSASVAVGLEVVQSGEKGIQALYPLTGTSTIVEPSRTLATGIATKLVAGGLTASASTTATDPVLSATSAPWSRVKLGSLSAAEDITNFRDPRWADSVARALYGALAEIYGVKGATR